MSDRSLLTAHRSATDVRPSGSMPTVEPATLISLSRREGGTPLYAASPAHRRVDGSARHRGPL